MESSDTKRDKYVNEMQNSCCPFHSAHFHTPFGEGMVEAEEMTDQKPDIILLLTGIFENTTGCAFR